MKILRIILIILTIIWMGIIFKFSSEPGNTSKGTSGNVSKMIAKIIYGENIEEKAQKIDPIIRKMAHYTAYLIRAEY